MKIVRLLIISILFMGTFQTASAATGEMGTGIPQFGTYSAPVGLKTIVWNLDSQTVGFPAGCPNLILSVSTMGLDSYKIAISTMLTARALGKLVRFYAHAARDGGCGVDYVQLID